MPELLKFRSNVYSQNGEDGVIEEILRRLGIEKGSFVEFGAWDGIHLSNSFRLLKTGWEGVYIEGDPSKFDDLDQNMKSFRDRVVLLRQYVESEGENKLDKLLAKTPLKKNFEMLSIDIDSYDWQVWERLKAYKPKIVIIEINSSLPVGVLQTHRGPSAQGSSFTSTLDLGREKGYSLVCHTGNLIFVDNELVGKLCLPGKDLQYPESLFLNSWVRNASSKNKKWRFRFSEIFKQRVA